MALGHLDSEMVNPAVNKTELTLLGARLVVVFFFLRPFHLCDLEEAPQKQPLQCGCL